MDSSESTKVVPFDHFFFLLSGKTPDQETCPHQLFDFPEDHTGMVVEINSSPFFVNNFKIISWHPNISPKSSR